MDVGGALPHHHLADRQSKRLQRPFGFSNKGVLREYPGRRRGIDNKDPGFAIEPGLCMMELGPQILSLSGKGLRVDRSSSKSCTMCKFFTFCLEVKVTVHLPLGDGKSLLSNDDSGY